MKLPIECLVKFVGNQGATDELIKFTVLYSRPQEYIDKLRARS